MRRVEFRSGRFLACAFLVLEPIVGLARAQRVMIWAITHKPFHRRDVTSMSGQILCDVPMSDGRTCTRLPYHKGVHQ